MPAVPFQPAAAARWPSASPWVTSPQLESLVAPPPRRPVEPRLSPTLPLPPLTPLLLGHHSFLVATFLLPCHEVPGRRTQQREGRYCCSVLPPGAAQCRIISLFSGLSVLLPRPLLATTPPPRPAAGALLTRAGPVSLSLFPTEEVENFRKPGNRRHMGRWRRLYGVHNEGKAGEVIGLLVQSLGDEVIHGHCRRHGTRHLPVG